MTETTAPHSAHRPTIEETIAFLRDVYSDLDFNAALDPVYVLKKDKSGEPVYLHPQQVLIKAKALFGKNLSPDLVDAILLHDVIEDTQKHPEAKRWTVEKLLTRGYSPRSLEIISLVTSGKPGLGVFTEEMLDPDEDPRDPEIKQIRHQIKAAGKYAARELKTKLAVLENEKLQDKCDRYELWIKAIIATGDLDAIKLKLADIEENLSPERTRDLKAPDRIKCHNKYQKPMELLRDYLEKQGVLTRPEKTYVENEMALNEEGILTHRSAFSYPQHAHPSARPPGHSAAI